MKNSKPSTCNHSWLSIPGKLSFEDAPKYPMIVCWALFYLRVRSLEPGTLCAFTLLYPFNADVTCSHLCQQYITPMSLCDSPMMSCSFLAGNPHACVQPCEPKFLAQSMSASVTTLDVLLWGQKF